MKLICKILPCLLLLASCAEEQPLVQHAVQQLDITFAEVQTRSLWQDLSDTEDKVSYVWEDNTDMLTAIRHEGQYVPFYESMAAAAQYYTGTRFETVDAAKSKIRLQTLQGVKYGVADGAYTCPVAAGDDMYCCHPINGHTTISASPAAVSVDMHLPGTFGYDNLENDLSALSEYAYVYTHTTLQSVSDNAVVANASHFSSACAIIRFNVTNNVTSDIIITGIKMEAADGTPLFPDVLRYADGSVAEQYDRSAYYSRLSTSIASVTIPRTQRGVFYNLCFPLDGDFGQVPLKFTIDTNYLTYQLKLDSDVLTNHKFEAGKLYTFNFSLEEKEIRLNTIDISQCTTYNIDRAESLNIVVTPDAVWQQTGNASAQMVFVSLGMTTTIGGTAYDVLWATCNLGAMEALETGHHYAWGEVATKDAAQYSPGGYTGTAYTDISGTVHDAVRQQLGDGSWMSTVPTKKMWEDLRDNCTWTWKPVKKVGEGTGEEVLDFDASVWEVTKKDASNKIVGVIYLPITGYSGLDDDSGIYTRVNKARCYYWSSTPCSATAGGTEQSWAFETVYEIDPMDPSIGHMSAPNILPCERYNGYAIRPVLLKERH